MSWNRKRRGHLEIGDRAKIAERVAAERLEAAERKAADHLEAAERKAADIASGDVIRRQRPQS